MTRRRRALVLGALGATLLVAVLAWHPWAGSTVPPRGVEESTPAEASGPAPVPAIIWPYGTPDDGPWADDEWVLALRQFDLLTAAANYHHDYSDPRLTAFASEQSLQSRAVGAFNAALGARDPDHRLFRPITYRPGPRPLVVLAVEPGKLGATIRVCVPESWGATSTDDVHDPPDTGIVRRWEMYRTPTGDIWPTDPHPEVSRGGGTTPCDLSRVRFGYFDPAPPYGEAVDPGTVIGPDGTPVAPVSSGTGSA